MLIYSLQLTCTALNIIDLFYLNSLYSDAQVRNKPSSKPDGERCDEVAFQSC